MSNSRADFQDFGVFENVSDELELTDVVQSNEIGVRIRSELEKRCFMIDTFFKGGFGFRVEAKGLDLREIHFSQLLIAGNEMDFS